MYLQTMSYYCTRAVGFSSLRQSILWLKQLFCHGCGEYSRDQPLRSDFPLCVRLGLARQYNFWTTTHAFPFIFHDTRVILGEKEMTLCFGRLVQVSCKVSKPLVASETDTVILGAVSKSEFIRRWSQNKHG